MSTEPVNPIARIYIELQGIYRRGSLIVYIVVPRVIYAKSCQDKRSLVQCSIAYPINSKEMKTYD